jgi:tripartite-type tricarboxylate transporter receptor subunit TctC
MRLHRRQFLHVAAGIGALPAVSHVANAQTYPSRPVRLIVGFTPGAASDIIARVFAKGAGRILGQEVVVENKPGAGSSIAAEYVARANKDGYTLFAPALSALTDEIVAGRSVDMSKDFAPIALLGNLAIVLSLVLKPTCIALWNLLLWLSRSLASCFMPQLVLARCRTFVRCC